MSLYKMVPGMVDLLEGQILMFLFPRDQDGVSQVPKKLQGVFDRNQRNLGQWKAQFDAVASKIDSGKDASVDGVELFDFETVDSLVRAIRELYERRGLDVSSIESGLEGLESLGRVS